MLLIRLVLVQKIHNSSAIVMLSALVMHWSYVSFAPSLRCMACNRNSTESLPAGCYNIGYPSLQFYLKLKSRKMFLVHAIHFSDLIILKFCTEHGSITAMSCAKFQHDRATEKYIMGKHIFVSFEATMWVCQQSGTSGSIQGEQGWELGKTMTHQ